MCFTDYYVLVHPLIWGTAKAMLSLPLYRGENRGPEKFRLLLGQPEIRPEAHVAESSVSNPTLISLSLLPDHANHQAEYCTVEIENKPLKPKKSIIGDLIIKQEREVWQVLPGPWAWPGGHRNLPDGSLCLWKEVHSERICSTLGHGECWRVNPPGPSSDVDGNGCINILFMVCVQQGIQWR